MFQREIEFLLSWCHSPLFFCQYIWSISTSFLPFLLQLIWGLESIQLFWIFIKFSNLTLWKRLSLQWVLWLTIDESTLLLKCMSKVCKQLIAVLLLEFWCGYFYLQKGPMNHKPKQFTNLEIIIQRQIVIFIPFCKYYITKPLSSPSELFSLKQPRLKQFRCLIAENASTPLILCD